MKDSPCSSNLGRLADWSARFCRTLVDADQLADAERRRALERLESGRGFEWLLMAPALAGAPVLVVAGDWTLSPLMLAAFDQKIDLWEPEPDRALVWEQFGNDVGAPISVEAGSLEGLRAHLCASPERYGLIVFEDTYAPLSALGTAVRNSTLAGVARALRPNGQCVVVTRNRYGISYLKQLLGRRDRRDPMRRHLPTLGRLQRHLRSAGLPVRRTYVFYPDHRAPQEMADLSWRAPTQWFGGAGRLLDRVGILPRLHNAYAMFAGSSQPSVLDLVLERIRVQLDPAERPRIQSCEFRNTGTALVRCDLGKGEQAMLRIPFSNTAELRLEHAWQAVRDVQNETPWVGVPEPLARDSVHGHSFFLERLCTGVTATELMRDAEREPRILENVLRFLLRFNGALPETRGANGDELSSMVRAWGEAIRGFAPDVTPILELVEEQIRTRLAALDFPAIRIHGDFHASNLICDAPTGEIRYVIDWDGSERPGPPALDLINFLMSRERHRLGISWGNAIVRAFEGRLFDELTSGLIERYLLEMKIPAELMRPLLLSHWLRTAAYHIRNNGGSPPPALANQIIFEPTQRFASLLR